MTKTITINIDKGGTGKTTITCNLVDYLAHTLNHKVLVIDGDRSTNATDFFNANGKSDITDIFLGNDVEFTKISDNLDMIEGSPLFKDDSLQLQSKQNNCMILYMWFGDNFERLKKYDYIIIDTHNDTNLVTKNCLAVANTILTVTSPSKNAYQGWLKMNETIKQLKSEVVDVVSRKTYIQAEHYLLANMVKTGEIESKNFLEVAEQEDRYIGMIQNKALLNRSLTEQESIFKARENMSASELKKQEGFYTNTINIFNKIIEL